MTTSIEDFSDNEYAKIKEIIEQRNIDILQPLKELTNLRKDLDSIFTHMIKNQEELRDFHNKWNVVMDTIFNLFDKLTYNLFHEVREEDR